MKVTLIEHTPNPDRVCDMAAHNCVSQDIPEEESKDFRSLEIAMRSGHTSVAEHAVFTFGIEGISRACSHQLVRHRLASYAQQSQRYVSMDGFEYVTPKTIQSDETVIKMVYPGDSLLCRPIPVTMNGEYRRIMKDVRDLYKKMIEVGVPEEDARYILPNACKTNIIVTMNGRELLNFFTLRTCNKAQWEIRELAIEMLKLVKPVAPVLFEEAGPNCMHDCGCQEIRPCNEPVPFGAHTRVNGEWRDDL